ncbi:MAG: CobW family GTP-binding protein [Velocimicrobium sp.]
MVKIDVISGFLGAGKTTLVKKLLKEALNGQKVVLIENEFGEIGIDGGFLKEAGIEIREMNSGCICCSLVGDFGTSLKEVIETYQPERILIEPSGVGKLSDVIKAVKDVHETGSTLNSAVAVVDAIKCKMFVKNFGEFFINQIEHAGTIILSRTDKLSEEKINDCVNLIYNYNKNATIITTPWDELDGDRILQAIENPSNLESEMLEEVDHEHHHEHDKECGCGDHHDHEHHHEHDENCGCGHHHDHDHHHADDVFGSWGFEAPISYTENELRSKLARLEEDETYGIVLRAKGMVKAKDKEEWIYFDYVPGEMELRSGKPDYTGKVCVIGSKLEEEALEILFKQ